MIHEDQNDFSVETNFAPTIDLTLAID